MRAAQRHRVSVRPTSSGVLACRIALAASVLIAGCGGGGDDPPTTPPPTNNGSFVVLLSAPSLTLAPGAQQTLTVTIGRNNFTGAVSLAAAPLPAGVTATFQPQQIASGATTGTLTLVAAANAAAGSTAVTVTGSGTGVSNASATLQLTVSAPPTTTARFTITPSVTSYVPGAGATFLHQPTIAIARDAGYTGAIAFTVIGLPPTIAAGITPSSATGASATMVIANAGTPNGTYNGTIRAVGANGGGERTAPIQVVIMPASTGSIVWRACSSSPNKGAMFIAVKDGTGPWTRVVSGDGGTTYAFDIAQATAQVAWVTIDSGVPRTTVHQLTRQELVARAASECALYPDVGTRTVTGQVAGMVAGQSSLVAMDRIWAPVAPPASGAAANYSLASLPATGALDLVAVRTSAEAGFIINPNRVVVRRALPVATANALVDFNAAEAFAPTTATWTIGNAGGEPFSVGQYFHTAGGTAGHLNAIAANEGTTTSRAIFGVPLDRMVAGDLHQTILTLRPTGAQPQRATRQVIVYARSNEARSVAFGPVLPTPTVTAVSVAGAGLLRAQGTLPTEYNSGVTMDVKSTGTLPRFATVHATRAALGAGNAYDLAMPDLTGTLGWDRNWNIRPGDRTEWWVSGGGPVLDLFDGRYVFPSTHRRWAGAATGITVPTDGSVYYMARATGSVTP